MTVSAGIVHDLPVHALDLCGVTWSGGYLYCAEVLSQQLKVVDPGSGRVVDRVGCRGLVGDVTNFRGGLLQVVETSDDCALRLIDPETGRELDQLPNPRPRHQVTGLETCTDGLWITYDDLQVIELRSIETLELIDSIDVEFPTTGVTTSEDLLFYTDKDARRIRMLDTPDRNVRLPVAVWGKPRAITWDGRLLWYCDHETLQLRAIELPGL